MSPRTPLSVLLFPQKSRSFYDLRLRPHRSLIQNNQKIFQISSAAVLKYNINSAARQMFTLFTIEVYLGVK